MEGWVSIDKKGKHNARQPTGSVTDVAKRPVETHSGEFASGLKTHIYDHLSQWMYSDLETVWKGSEGVGKPKILEGYEF